MFGFRGIVGLSVVTLAGMGHVQAETAAGSFQLNGNEQEFPVVSAFRVRDQANANVYETLVLLTKTEPDRDSIKNAENPYMVAINDPATSGDYLSLFVAADGTVGLNAHIGGVQYLDTSGLIFNQKGSLSAECATNSAERVACDVRTQKTVQTPSGKSWDFAAVFDAAVLARPPGKPVAEGGGAAGKALSSLSAALDGNDLEAILTWLSPDNAEEYRGDWRSPEENLEAVKDSLSFNFPKNGQVTGGEYRGDDEVSLVVEAVLKDWGEEPVVFQVTMVRASDQDRWLYESGRFIGFSE